ncbi:MAG: hypothetical protein QXT13_10850 [Pyrobaculum sp.]
MRLLNVFLLIVAALALWFLLFEAMPAQLPKPKYQYLTINVSQFFMIWLFVLFATIAAYVASKKSR